jgi:hypothetical protein
VKIKSFLFFITYIIVNSSAYAIENEFFSNDYVSLILEQIEARFGSTELINIGKYDDNKEYIVLKITNNIQITISTDENEDQYIIGNVETNEAMQEILSYLTEIYSEPIHYLNGNEYTAFFHDTENLYIQDNFPDYIGTFTLYGNIMFVEEVISRENIIVQRQWSTSDFYETMVSEMGEGWGYFTAWDTVEYEEITLPAQYMVRQWSNTGDCFSAIAGLPFIFGDPIHWRVIYEANRNKLPNPSNPHLILPGTILDIPSLNGEQRSGIWQYE